MNQKERLAICSSCTRRKLDHEQGYVCQLTGRFADFKETCPHYVKDQTVTDTIKVRTKERPWVPLFDPVPAPEELEKKEKKEKKASKSTSPSKVALKKLRKYQSFPYALVGGLLVASVSGLGLAFVSASSGYPGVYMIPGVGLLVGIAVRFFGAGITRIFGILAALLALAASLMGYYLSQAGFLEELQVARILSLPAHLKPDLILNTMRDSFVPLDLLFYGLAAMLGYLLSIRRINRKKMAKLEGDGDNGAPALYWLRLPLILAGILVPVYFGYTRTKKDTDENNTLYYESGEKMSEGVMKKGLETGEWTSWQKNGNLRSNGYYVNGQKDSLWKWYDESGILTGTGMYSHGRENGTWISYYPDGLVSDSGAYLDGLKEGPWKYYHENGGLKVAVHYKAGKMHGERILLSASGTVVKEEYFENGVIIEKD